jgi:hypothetical protein
VGFYQSRKRGGNRKRLLCFWKTVLLCAQFLRTFGFLPAVSQAKQKRTPILIESTCVCRIGVARLELAASCSQSRRATNCATPRHLAAQLHRQDIVYLFLRGSSIQNPQLTVLHGLLFFSRQNRQLATAEKDTMTGVFCVSWAWLWRNCPKENTKTIQSAKLVAL